MKKKREWIEQRTNQKEGEKGRQKNEKNTKEGLKRQKPNLRSNFIRIWLNC